MKRLVLAAVLAATAALGGVAPSFAQPVPVRQEQQRDRIQQGVASGELAHGETHRLRVQQRSIARQEDRMRGRSGGRLNRHERRVLEARQNRASRAIYRDKHNGAVG